MKRLARMILSRTSLILLLLLLQIALFLYILLYVSKFTYVHTFLYIISVIIVMYLIYKEENPVYKLSWIVPILIFPLFGGIFYLLYRNRNIGKRVLKRFSDADQERIKELKLYDHTEPDNHKISKYLSTYGWYSYHNTETTFLGSGQEMFEALKDSLIHAKKYIFMEFFIIKNGRMWQDILEILKLKATEGVEIHLIYDDFGSSTLPYNFVKKMKAYNIHAYQFNPMRIHLNFAMNYRDHKKIVVIDGKIGFTGGINIGDEYINLEHPFGKWQDAGIKLEGNALYSIVTNFVYTLRFMRQERLDVEDYINKDCTVTNNQSLVIPFFDVPIDKDLTNKNVYFSMIMRAQREILITTPYLIIDNELSTALKLAVKTGVKVKIIIPYIPDKKLVFMVTESYAEELSTTGVEIYRFTPGFIHSKMMIVDGEIAMIGTANLDFRSLYLHFENSVYLEDHKTIGDMIDYFNETCEASELIDKFQNKNIFTKILKIILKGFASLM